VLGDADAIAVGLFCHSDVGFDRGVEIDMVAPDACGERQLQPRRLCDALSRQVGRPERLGYNHIGVRKLAIELGVFTVLIGDDHECMAGVFKILAQAKLPRYPSDKFTPV
jgi:hypothetical protein